MLHIVHPALIEDIIQ